MKKRIKEQADIPVSGIVSRLAKAVGLTAREIMALAPFARNVAMLAKLDPETLAEKTGISLRKLRSVRDAAQLLGFPKMTEERAAALARDGSHLEAWARHNPVWLYNKLRDRGLVERLAITLEEVITWSVQARRWARVQRGKPALRPPVQLFPPKKMKPFVVTYIVIDAEMTWEEIARRYYPNVDNGVELGEKLRWANGRAAPGTVAAGERIILPDFPNAMPQVRELKQVVTELLAFADYLDTEEAERLAQAGYHTPGALLHLSHSNAATLTGINPGKLEKLQAQVLLSSLPRMSPETARYIASREGWGSIRALSKAKVDDLIGVISEGVSLGYLTYDYSIDSAQGAEWIVEIYDQDLIEGIARTFPSDPGLYFPSESPCETPTGPDRWLENAYSYRFIPQEFSEIALADQLNTRLEFLARARDIIQAGFVDATGMSNLDPGIGVKFTREVNDACSLTLEDSLIEWGLSDPGMRDDHRMNYIKRYLRDNSLIIKLLHMLTEGHRAFQHGEFALALAAYGRAKALFGHPQLGSADEAEIRLSDYWEHNASGVPKFADTNTLGHNANKLDRIAVYYDDRAAGNAPRELRTEPSTPLLPNDLLERILHVPFADYDRQILWGNQSVTDNKEPFRRYLYYIRHFVIPMCQADVYLELGNYCRALELYFSVYYDSTFTRQLPAGDENILQDHIKRDDDTGTVAIFSLTTIDTSAPDRYYEPYLHTVEKQVIRLRVTETMLRWAEYHYRRDERESARARYAQVIRILFPEWRDFLPENFATPQQLEEALQRTTHNPRALAMAFEAHTQLLKIRDRRNFLNYPDDYVPIWTYPFLLNAARYLIEHARQLERDSVQALASAEQETGNLRLMNQALSTARSQRAIEERRIDEADAGKQLSEANQNLAVLRDLNAQDRIDEIQRLGDDMLGLGTFQGTYSGAATGYSLAGQYGIVPGAIIGGRTAYLSNQIELQMKENEFKHQKMETERAIFVARAETARAVVTADIVRMQRNLAMMNVLFAQSNLEFAQAKTLNADFWYNTSRRLREFAHTYLNRAIEVAFLAEQALEFQEERRIDRIKFDYAATEGRLASEALLTDLDGIEFERIVSRRTKNMPLRYTISLRERDFIAFSEFKRTGEITFDFPLWEFDMSHPGTFHQQIVRVEVLVRALTTGSGIRGSLSKSGLSYLRFRPIPSKFTRTAVNTAPDWIQYTPSPFMIAPQVLSPESLVLSSYDQRRDAIMLRPDPGEQMFAFEGSGLGTTWTLRLEPASNDFDLNTIADVNLILYVQTDFDENLHDTIELERRKLIPLGQFVTQRSRGYSFREIFPDQFYHLHNATTPPAQNLRRRIVTFRTQPADFPPNQVNRRITGLVLTCVGINTLLPIQPSLTSLTRSPALTEPLTRPNGLNWFPNGGLDWFHPLADPNVNSTTVFAQAPDDLWALWIDADANPALCRPGTFRVDTSGDAVLDTNGNPIPDATAAGKPLFDLSKIQAIKDIWFILGYRYELLGEAGDPIPFWAHFAASPQGQYVTAAVTPTVAETDWTTDNLVGVGVWNVTDGRLQQTAAGTTSIHRPMVNLSWNDMSVDAQVIMPTTLGDTVGIVARYAQAGASDHPNGYYLTVTAAAGPVFDIRLERRGAGGGVIAEQLGVNLVAGLSYLLHLRVAGNTIEARIGQQRLFRITDVAVPAGGVGLYATGTTGAFTDVWVSNLANRA